MIKYGLYYPFKDGLMLKKKKKNTTQSLWSTTFTEERRKTNSKYAKKKVDEIKQVFKAKVLKTINRNFFNLINHIYKKNISEILHDANT